MLVSCYEKVENGKCIETMSIEVGIGVVELQGDQGRFEPWEMANERGHPMDLCEAAFAAL